MADAITIRRKTIENTQFGRVAKPDGTCTYPAQGSDDGKEPLLDADGRLIVRIADARGYIGAGFDVISSGAGTPLESAYVRQKNINLGTGITKQLYDLIGHNHHPTDLLYVQLFIDEPGPLVGGEKSSIIIPVPGANANFSLASPVIFTQFLTIAISTTPLTWTDPGGDYLWFYGHAH